MPKQISALELTVGRSPSLISDSSLRPLATESQELPIGKKDGKHLACATFYRRRNLTSPAIPKLRSRDFEVRTCVGARCLAEAVMRITLLTEI